MIYIVTINNKKYEVEVERGQASILSEKNATEPAAAPHSVPAANPASIPSAVSSGIPEAKAPARQDPPHGSVETVKSPLPGTVLDIRVTEGAKVKKGELLFILEAMKMENEVVAGKDGTITKIRAVKGSSVSTGDILAEITG